MQGVRVHNVQGHALEARHVRLTAINSQFSNAGLDCLNLKGGHYEFVHCTIAQFYPLVGGKGVALKFSNFEDKTPLPLEQLLFENCIITGSGSDDIMGSQSDRYKDLAFNYAFSHCLLNTPKVKDDAHFIDCLWEKDNKEHSGAKNFTPEFDYDKLVFKFQLDSLSSAVNAGSYEIASKKAPYDLRGINRLQDIKPDLGCYERKEE